MDLLISVTLAVLVWVPLIIGRIAILVSSLLSHSATETKSTVVG